MTPESRTRDPLAGFDLDSLLSGGARVRPQRIALSDGALDAPSALTFAQVASPHEVILLLCYLTIWFVASAGVAGEAGWCCAAGHSRTSGAGGCYRSDEWGLIVL